MREPGPKYGRGALPIAINWGVLDSLCESYGTADEIASYFRCSTKTIARAVYRRYRQSFVQYSATRRLAGNARIRLKQYQMALAGNVTMLIWLGKQYLGQSDRRVT